MKNISVYEKWLYLKCSYLNRYDELLSRSCLRTYNIRCLPPGRVDNGTACRSLDIAATSFANEK